MKLELYFFESCPFCQKVFKYMETKKIRHPIETYDILKDPKAYQSLLQLNHGEDQVPCLVIDGSPMLESDDIIAWMEDHLT